MKKLLLFAFAIPMLTTNAQHNIIPTPVSYETTPVVFSLADQIVLDMRTDDPRVQQYTGHFEALLKRAGITVARTSQNSPVITIELSAQPQQELGEEGYTLEVAATSIQLVANAHGGIINGLQTLRQLLPPEFESGADVDLPVTIPGCRIRDYPRFGWRGLMLDVSRHFFLPEDVKAFIDRMALYKFNTFHWHLTDDEGWRIEIKSLPRLTEIGAWRVERHGRFGTDRAYPKPGEKATYGGYYTQEEIREIVQYAAERNITIVPEIDMPGHSMAALAAYPELSTRKEEKFVNPGAKFAEWHGDGTFTMLIENTLNPADEAVYTFVDKVFTEIAELFPGTYIHMGGDECYKGYWEADPGVQAFMKEYGIHDSHELQSYFVKRVEKIISSKGKKLIGWDEILEGGLAEGAAVMSWRGMAGGIEAAKMGHKVVMSPTTYCYLDYTQGDYSVENRIYASLSLDKAYQFEPVPPDIAPELILGGQGNMWTEAVPTIQFAFYMVYPRAFAIAESVWSPKESKRWDDFIGRVETHFDRFDHAGVNISKAVLDPVVEVTHDGNRLMCTLTNPVPDTELYYTVNNTYPPAFGQRYTQPFIIPEGDLSLRVQTVRDGRGIGRELIIGREELVKRAR